MQNVQADVRLTAITLLNDVLLIFGPSMPVERCAEYNNLWDEVASQKANCTLVRQTPSAFRTQKAPYFENCVNYLNNLGTLHVAAKVVDAMPSWASHQALWSSENDFADFVNTEYCNHDKLFSASVTLFSRIAAADGGYAILRNIGAFSLIQALPYFVMSPPSVEEARILFGANSASVHTFLETIANSYLIPVIELLILVSTVHTSSYQSEQFEVCLQFLCKNMNTVEYFLRMRLLTFTGLTLAEKLSRLIKLVFFNICSAESAVVKSSLEFLQFEKKIVPEACHLLKIFGPRSIPSNIWKLMGIQIYDGSNGFDNNSWWSMIFPVSEIDSRMSGFDVSFTQLNAFDLERVRISLEILHNASTLLQLLSANASGDSIFSLNININSIILAFNSCSEVALLYLDSGRKSDALSKIDEIFKTRSFILHKCLLICEDLINVIKRYLSSNLVSAKNFRRSVEDIKVYCEKFPRSMSSGSFLEEHEISKRIFQSYREIMQLFDK